MQIISVTSERLQAAIRSLLPSQAGFSEDLQAVNTIQPIIDLTTIAEGSTLPLELQTATTYVSTYEQLASGTTTLTTTPGFYRLYGVITGDGATGSFAGIRMFDGAATKNIYLVSGTVHTASETTFEQVFYVRAGDRLEIHSNSANYGISVTFSQIADAQGNLLDPPGYTSE